MISAGLTLLLLLFFAMCGRSNERGWEAAFLQILGGLAFASLILFLLVFAGCFNWPWIGGSFLLLALLRAVTSGLPSAKQIAKAAAWSCIATALTVVLYRFTPPY